MHEEAAQPLRQAILDAALAELLMRGIDDFTVEGSPRESVSIRASST